MKYTIENNEINIPDSLIKAYEESGKVFRLRKIKIMYQNAKNNQAEDIEKDIIDQIKADIEMQKNFPKILNNLPEKGVLS